MKIAVLSLLACAGLPGFGAPPAQSGAAKPKTAAAAASSAVQPVSKPAPAPAPQTAKPAAPPAPKSETLRFNVNWPSGLSLGEGELTSTLGADGWRFSMKVEAAIPAFPIVESAKAAAAADLCSTELTKEATRGSRRVGEKTTFDASTLTATRTTTNTPGGGKTEVRVNACAKDALTFVQFIRRELAAGRIPQAQPVYYGAAYQTRLQYVGTQRVRSGNEMVEADRLNAFIKGPASEYSVELLFARDAGRTPISVTIPVTIGKFTVEFER